MYVLDHIVSINIKYDLPVIVMKRNLVFGKAVLGNEILMVSLIHDDLPFNEIIFGTLYSCCIPGACKPSQK